MTFHRILRGFGSIFRRVGEGLTAIPFVFVALCIEMMRLSESKE